MFSIHTNDRNGKAKLASTFDETMSKKMSDLLIKNT